MSSRRTFIKSGALFLAAGSVASVVGSVGPARASRPRVFTGYGELVSDPDGILDLPRGFRYRVLSRAGDVLAGGGVVPSAHDGMAAFSAGRRGTWLVRNHELSPVDIAEDGLIGIPALAGPSYDPEGSGGTMTLLVSRERRLSSQVISLAGTVDNCAGGPTPWGTWLTCEETDAVLARPHGYVFEVDPRRGGNPEPIVAMGRFEHEAVSFDRRGRAYLTEDASEPFGCLYRFTPAAPLGGRGSLHAGGVLEALVAEGVAGDLSAVQAAGARLAARWVRVPNVNPAPGETPVREQAILLGATPVMKAEGTWRGGDGSIWFVSSYAGGPGAEDAEDVTAAEHVGQIWRYDPAAQHIELVVLFPAGSPFDGPDNITASPHGFALACTDGDEDNWLIAIGEDGKVHPFARNALNDSELAGATFSPNGQTLFTNVQDPGFTVAIWGPWGSGRE